MTIIGNILTGISFGLVILSVVMLLGVLGKVLYDLQTGRI